MGFCLLQAVPRCSMPLSASMSGSISIFTIWIFLGKPAQQD
jgi:hypothetical protein